MTKVLIGLVAGVSIASMTGCTGSNAFAGLFQAHQLPPEASQTLAAMTFESAPVTVRGHVTMALFAVPGTTGMITVQGTPEKYVFLTAATHDLAKQGFTRFSLSPGKEVVVTGVLAKNGQKIENFIAARADVIATPDGQTLFNRAELPVGLEH